MAETKASEATPKAETPKTETKAPAAKKARAPRKTAAVKSAGEGENLPGASAPAVAAEAAAQKSDTTLTAKEAVELQNKKGDFGPFKDSAAPVGAALEAVIEAVDTAVDFEDGVAPYTASSGDVFVAVREHNQRNVVEIAPSGWNGPGQIFAPYQVDHLIKALQDVKGKLRS